jgi:hypothetical protein
VSTHHEEFPMLTPEAQAVFEAALEAITRDVTISLKDLCRALAASQRKAMKQPRTVYGDKLWDELNAIADNLHSPPPTPPTLAEAREARVGNWQGPVLRWFTPSWHRWGGGALSTEMPTQVQPRSMTAWPSSLCSA